MPSKFASGKHSIAECDRCGQRYKLHQLKREIIKTNLFNLLVCPECWDPDQPQLQLGMYPVDDPQGVSDPRPDVGYRVSGTTGLQVYQGGNNTVCQFGYPQDGSRQTQWAWNPVGGASEFDRALTPNSLIPVITIGTVSISTT